MEDSVIHCIGCGDDMNAFSSTFTDFRVSEGAAVLGRGIFFQAVSEVFDSSKTV